MRVEVFTTATADPSWSGTGRRPIAAAEIAEKVGQRVIQGVDDRITAATTHGLCFELPENAAAAAPATHRTWTTISVSPSGASQAMGLASPCLAWPHRCQQGH
jgi:hypothetical protein